MTSTHEGSHFCPTPQWPFISWILQHLHLFPRVQWYRIIHHLLVTSHTCIISPNQTMSRSKASITSCACWAAPTWPTWSRTQKEFKHLLICWPKIESLCKLYPHEEKKIALWRPALIKWGQFQLSEKAMPRRLKKSLIRLMVNKKTNNPI